LSTSDLTYISRDEENAVNYGSCTWNRGVLMDMKTYDSFYLEEIFYENRTEILQTQCCQACADDSDCQMIHLDTDTLLCSFLDRTDYEMNPIDDNPSSYFAIGCSMHWQVADKASHCREACHDSYSDWTSATRKKRFVDSPFGTEQWVIECQCSTCEDCGEVKIVRDNNLFSVGWDAFIIFAVQCGSFSLFTFQFLHLFIFGSKGTCCQQTHGDVYNNMKRSHMCVSGKPPYSVLPFVNAQMDFINFMLLWGVFATLRSIMFLSFIPSLGLPPQLRVNFQINSTHNWAIGNCILFCAGIEYPFVTYILLCLLADQCTVKQRSSNIQLGISAIGWVFSACVLWEMTRYTHTYFFMGFLCSFLFCASLTHIFYSFKPVPADKDKVKVGEYYHIKSEELTLCEVLEVNEESYTLRLPHTTKPKSDEEEIEDKESATIVQWKGNLWTTLEFYYSPERTKFDAFKNCAALVAWLCAPIVHLCVGPVDKKRYYNEDDSEREMLHGHDVEAQSPQTLATTDLKDTEAEKTVQAVVKYKPGLHAEYNLLPAWWYVTQLCALYWLAYVTFIDTWSHQERLGIMGATFGVGLLFYIIVFWLVRWKKGLEKVFVFDGIGGAGKKLPVGLYYLGGFGALLCAIVFMDLETRANLKKEDADEWTILLVTFIFVVFAMFIGKASETPSLILNVCIVVQATVYYTTGILSNPQVAGVSELLLMKLCVLWVIVSGLVILDSQCCQYMTRDFLYFIPFVEVYTFGQFLGPLLWVVLFGSVGLTGWFVYEYICKCNVCFYLPCGLGDRCKTFCSSSVALEAGEVGLVEIQETNNGVDDCEEPVDDCEEPQRPKSRPRSQTVVEDLVEDFTEGVDAVLNTIGLELSALHYAMLGFSFLAIGVFIWAATVVLFDIGFLAQDGIRNVICLSTDSQRGFLGSSIFLPILTMAIAAAENLQENGIDAVAEWAEELNEMAGDDEEADVEEQAKRCEDAAARCENAAHICEDITTAQDNNGISKREPSSL
jgi:hypothetical protein